MPWWQRTGVSFVSWKIIFQNQKQRLTKEPSIQKVPAPVTAVAINFKQSTIKFRQSLSGMVPLPETSAGTPNICQPHHHV
jgi:hypothetical protein